MGRLAADRQYGRRERTPEDAVATCQTTSSECAIVRTFRRSRGNRQLWPKLGRVWTALRWQGVFEALRSAGRGGHVSGLSMRLCHAPLAMMPFARTGSRPIARARSATAQNGFSRSGGFNRLGASTPLCPFQHRRRESSAPKLYTATASGSRYRSPLVISAQTIRAFLFASATAATLAGRRASSWTNQGRFVPCRCA